MSERRHFFTLHELLIMAALAALGGVMSSAISNMRAALHAVLPNPVGMQPLAGIHVLWFVIAVGMIRKPGAATATSLLTGIVELLSSNPHGLFVLMYAGFAGLAVDAVWLLLRRRHHLFVYMLAGGVAAATNVVVIKISASLPTSGTVGAGLALYALMAFASGAVLAGLLGWWLLRACRLAGVIGADPGRAPAPEHRPGRPARTTPAGVKTPP
jgi:energy-coupling factor transport system substrate-specific component